MSTPAIFALAYNGVIGTALGLWAMTVKAAKTFAYHRQMASLQDEFITAARGLCLICVKDRQQSELYV